MTFLVDAYNEDEAPNTKGGVDKRTVLRLDPRLAPVKVAVLPLSRNADLSPKAKAPGRRAAPQLERRLRRLRRHRPPLPPPGRDRHAVLRHRRLRHPRRRRGHRARARHDGAGAGRRSTGITSLLRRASRRLLTPSRRAHWPSDPSTDARPVSVLSAALLGTLLCAALVGCSDDVRPSPATPSRPEAASRVRLRVRLGQPGRLRCSVPGRCRADRARASSLDVRRDGDGGLRGRQGVGRRPRHHRHQAGEDVVRGVVRRLGARPTSTKKASRTSCASR